MVARIVEGDDDGVRIDAPGQWENEQGPLDWYAISDSHGIFAYANTDEHAQMIADLFIKTAVTETMEEHIGGQHGEHQTHC